VAFPESAEVPQVRADDLPDGVGVREPEVPEEREAETAGSDDAEEAMTEHLKTPWTEQQVAALNEYQRSGRFHPFTCGHDSTHDALVATPEGWVCPDCDYRQDWAHAFMADPFVRPAYPDLPGGANHPQQFGKAQAR
jgi:hypothetical protein